MSERLRSSSNLPRGFTLIETLVVVIVLGVVLAIAVPSYTGVVNGGRLTSTANELLTAMKLARAEAMRRNQRVVLCPSINGTACGGNWSNGWLVFEDLNRDGGVSSAEPVVATGVPAQATEVLVSPAISATQRLSFGADGFARTPAGILVNARFAVCRPVTRPEDNVRDVTMTAGSRVSVTRRAASAACVAPANP